MYSILTPSDCFSLCRVVYTVVKNFFLAIQNMGILNKTVWSFPNKIYKKLETFSDALILFSIPGPSTPVKHTPLSVQRRAKTRNNFYQIIFFRSKEWPLPASLFRILLLKSDVKPNSVPKTSVCIKKTKNSQGMVRSKAAINGFIFNDCSSLTCPSEWKNDYIESAATPLQQETTIAMTTAISDRTKARSAPETSIASITTTTR